MSESESLSNTSTEHICSIQTINTNGNKSVVVHGSPQQLCSWQVTKLQGLSFLQQFLDKDSKSNQDVFLYIEQAGDLEPCESRYVSIDIHSYPCTVGFPDRNLTIYVQGNLSLSISEASTVMLPSGLPSDCQDIQMKEVTLIPNATSNYCYTIKGYDSIITCASKNASIMASHQNTDCNLRFPPHCNATLGNREVCLECSITESLTESKYLLFGSIYTYTAMLIYQINTVSLNLSANSIYKIEPGALQDLNQLQQLYLGNNNLEEIRHLFRNLVTLIILDITYNHIKILKSGTFSDLCKLEKLLLTNNQISHLDINIFQNLINLQFLNLAFNKLTTLHPSTFEHLARLRELALTNNRLSDLSHLLLSNLTDLTELYFRYNKLHTLQDSPFKNLNNLEILIAKDNRLNTLGPNIFEGLHNLIQLSLNRNHLGTLPAGLFQEVPRLEILFLQVNKLLCYHQTLSRDYITYPT